MPILEHWHNTVSVKVRKVKKLTPERERLAEISQIARRAIATQSTVDDKPALAMIVHVAEVEKFK